MAVADSGVVGVSRLFRSAMSRIGRRYKMSLRSPELAAWPGLAAPMSIQPHWTACRQNTERIEWYLWTVAGARPYSEGIVRYTWSSFSGPSLLSFTSPRAGLILASILRRFS